jgi:hypothetical protein
MGLGYAHDEEYPTGNWHFEGNTVKDTSLYWELYDLKSDPSEMRNVYSEPGYAAIRDSLTRALFSLKKHYDDSDETYPELYTITKHMHN